MSRESSTSVTLDAGLVTSFDPSELSPFDEWRELGEGGYSEVYKAMMHGTPVAVKQATSRKKSSGEALLREMKFLRMLGPHPNIVLPYGSFVEEGKVHMVMQYTRHCLRSDRIARSCDAVKVFAGVARSLVRLHNLGIVHRDVKARNVLIDEAHDTAVLIDFGLACHLQQDDKEWIGRTVGTRKYRPPEMRDARPAHPALDIYCLGLMIQKLLRQREKRGGSSEEGRSRSYDRSDTRLLREIADETTASSPAERPSAWEILRRLQDHLGHPLARCKSSRRRVPLDNDSAAAAAARSAVRKAAHEGSREGGGRGRKRRRGSDDRERRGSSSGQ